MSVDGEPSRDGAQGPVEPALAEAPYGIAVAPAVRVRWGRATALHLTAGGIAGVVGPVWIFQGGPALSSLDLPSLAISIVVVLISGVVVALLGAGIPLLAAWLSWRLASRRHPRRLRGEVLAVILGAIGASLIPSALPFFFMVTTGAPWTSYATTVLLLGGVPGLAFALWVAAGWRRAARAAAGVG